MHMCSQVAQALASAGSKTLVSTCHGSNSESSVRDLNSPSFASARFSRSPVRHKLNITKLIEQHAAKRGIFQTGTEASCQHMLQNQCIVAAEKA